MHKARPSYEYGEKLLKQMGWTEGKGLGKNEDGMAEFIKVKKKINTKGMGFNGVDDRWIEHQEDFDSLLSDLNGGNPAAGEQKLISVEKRAFKVGGRVHYSKFLRGKDLSQKKQEELDAIVVKRRQKNVETVPEDRETGEEQPLSGVQTHTSNLSYQEYFAERLKASRRRRGFGEDESETHSQEAVKGTAEYVDSGSMDVKSPKKHERRSKRHCTGNESTYEQYHDHPQTNGTEPMEDCAEQDVPRRTKKSKNKPSQDSSHNGQLEDSSKWLEDGNVVVGGLGETTTPAEICHSLEDTPKRTKKKSKDKPSQYASDGTPDTSSEQAEERGVVAEASGQTFVTPGENHLDKGVDRWQKRKSKHKWSQDEVDADHLEANNKQPGHESGDEAFAETVASATDSCAQTRARKKSQHKPASEAELPDTAEMGNRLVKGEQPALDSELPKQVKKKSKQKPSQDSVVPGESDTCHSATEERTPQQTKLKQKALQKMVAEEVDDLEDPNEAAADLRSEELASRRKKRKEKVTAEVCAVEMEEVQIEPEVKVKKKPKTRKVEVDPAEEEAEQAKPVSLTKIKSERKEKVKAEKTSEPAAGPAAKPEDEPEACIPEASPPSSLPGNCKNVQKRPSPTSGCQVEGEPSRKKPTVAEPATPFHPVTRRAAALAVVKEEPDTTESAELAKDVTPSKKHWKAVLIKQEPDNAPETKPVVKKVVKKIVEKAEEVSQDVTPPKKPCKATPVKEEPDTTPESKPAVKKVVRKVVKKAEEPVELAKDTSPSKKPGKAMLIKKEPDDVPETKPAVKKVVKKIVKKAEEVSQDVTPPKKPCKATPVKKQSDCKPESKPLAKKLVKKTVVKGSGTVEASKGATPSKKLCKATGNAQAPKCSPHTNSAHQTIAQKNDDVTGRAAVQSSGRPVPSAPCRAKPFDGDQGVTTDPASANKPADNPGNKPAYNPPPHPSNRNDNKEGPVLKEIELQPWHQDDPTVFQPGAEVPEVSWDLASEFSEWFVGMVDKSVGSRLNPNKTCHLGKEDFAAALTEHIWWQHRYSNWIRIPGYGTDEWMHKSVGVLVNQMRAEEQAKKLAVMKVPSNKKIFVDSDDDED